MSFLEREYPYKTSWKREATRIAIWISLNLADLILTIVTMQVMGGGFIEGNPIAALIGENVVGLVSYKITLTFAAILLLSRMHKLPILQWLNIVMAAVVGWNLALFCVS